mmetsp:Transcript_14263/g.38782  ORF Transcript_14263/g.38782 Transcript_14263/m.38782 type:complete len:212 (-) Transcript_14263:60-695(-)
MLATPHRHFLQPTDDDALLGVLHHSQLRLAGRVQQVPDSLHVDLQHRDAQRNRLTVRTSTMVEGRFQSAGNEATKITFATLHGESLASRRLAVTKNTAMHTREHSLNDRLNSPVDCFLQHTGTEHVVKPEVRNGPGEPHGRLGDTDGVALQVPSGLTTPLHLCAVLPSNPAHHAKGHLAVGGLALFRGKDRPQLAKLLRKRHVSRSHDCRR